MHCCQFAVNHLKLSHCYFKICYMMTDGQLDKIASYLEMQIRGQFSWNQMHQGTGRKWQFTILKDCPLCHGWNPPFIWAWGLQLHASPCLHSRIPQLFQDFKWPTSLKQYESCSHINLPNQCTQQMAKITKETSYGGCHSLPHEYLSPSSSCRSRFFNWKFPDRFHLGRWLWSAGACLWVIWVMRHLRNQNINTEII